MQSITYFLKIEENKSLLFRYWNAEGAKSCVCLLHGNGSHSGTFQELAEALTLKGIAVCAIDFIGNGKSYGKRGHLLSYKKANEVVDLLLSEADKLFPETRKILYGHGLGGNIILNYYFTKKPSIHGLILSCPWFRIVNPPLKFLVSLAEVLQYVIPKCTFNTDVTIDKLTRDNAVLKILSTDPDLHHKISLRLFMLAFLTGKRISSQGYRVSKPMLLMHGSDDKVTSHKASVDFSRNTGQFTTFKSWSGAYHELHNDIIKNDVFEYIINWIQEKIH